MYLSAHSFGSVFPAARSLELFGIQYSPPEMSVVPPGPPARSSMTTSAPACFADTAAAKAAAPLPTTTTSTSRSHVVGKLVATSGPAAGPDEGVDSCPAARSGRPTASAAPAPAALKRPRRETC